jgi:hypothetical protein
MAYDLNKLQALLDETEAISAEDRRRIYEAAQKGELPPDLATKLTDGVYDQSDALFGDILETDAEIVRLEEEAALEASNIEPVVRDLKNMTIAKMSDATARGVQSVTHITRDAEIIVEHEAGKADAAEADAIRRKLKGD